MNCLECQELLQRRLDGEVLAEPELEHHLADCPACRALHQAATRLLEVVRTPVQAPGRVRELWGSKNVADSQTPSWRIVARVLQDRRQRRRRWRAGVALAASVLLMALAGYLWWPPTEPPPLGNADGGLENMAHLQPPLNETIAEARRAVGSLTNRLAESTREQARILLASNPLDLAPALSAADPLEAALDPAVQPLRQTGQGVSEGVQTVTRSAQRAMSYLVREIARLEAGARNP